MLVLAFPWPLFFACDMEILNKGSVVELDELCYNNSKFENILDHNR